MASPQNSMVVAHQVEVAQASELVVVGYAGRAIAETDLGPNIKVDLGAAVGRRAPECFALGGLTHDFIWMLVPDIYRYFKKC